MAVPVLGIFLSPVPTISQASGVLTAERAMGSPNGQPNVECGLPNRFLPSISPYSALLSASDDTQAAQRSP
jgi:hypothetical protein